MSNDYIDNKPDTWMVILFGLLMWGCLGTDMSQDMRPIDPPKTENVDDKKKVIKFSDRHLIVESSMFCGEIMANMTHTTDSYGTATLADLYEFAGLSSDWVDHTRGWADLTSKSSRMWVHRLMDGSYLLAMPPTKHINSLAQHKNKKELNNEERAQFDWKKAIDKLNDIENWFITFGTLERSIDLARAQTALRLLVEEVEDILKYMERVETKDSIDNPSTNEHYNFTAKDDYFIFCLDRADAEYVMMSLIDIVDSYGYATVADVRKLIGQDISHIDIRFGWTDLADAKIEESKVNCNLAKGVSKYHIRMPAPKQLTNQTIGGKENET